MERLGSIHFADSGAGCFLTTGIIQDLFISKGVFVLSHYLQSPRMPLDWVMAFAFSLSHGWIKCMRLLFFSFLICSWQYVMSEKAKLP